MLTAYFVPELADAAAQKRMRMLRMGGHRVAMLGFERRLAAPPVIGTPMFVLGHTANGKFVQRILSVVVAFPRAWGARKYWKKADVILARNLEMLTIACLLAPIVGARGRIVYECLDIHRLMLSNSVAGKMLRAIERRWLRRVSAVLTSSPAFVTNYFEQVQHFDGPIMLVENKVFALDVSRPALATRLAGPPWKIAWCGVLRCAKSLQILSALAAQLKGKVEIDLWGAPALDQIPDFHARVAAAPHIRFHGAYKPDALPRLYGGAHFVWAIDYFEAGGNSDWLLPNRLYEGLYHGAVPLALAGTETARWLSAHGVGAILDEPLAESLRAFFNTRTAAEYKTLSEAAASLDPQLVAFTLEDCRALLDAS